jgi:hypothetical protein
VTTTEPNAGEQKRGRHAKRDDPDRPANDDREPSHAAARPEDEHHGERTDDEPDTPDEPETPADGEGPTDDEPAADEHPSADEPDDEPPAATAVVDDAPTERPQREPAREQAPDEPSKQQAWHAIAHHPAGSSLLTAAGLVTGLALAPLLFEQLRFEVATRAADAARSATAPWPAGGEPWFWPGWVATTATVVALVVLVVAAIGVRVPDVVVLATAAVLAVTTARAAWATIDVLNAHLWELVPLCIVCLIAFGSAVAAVFRWRSGDSSAAGAGTGEVAGVTLGAWLLVVLLFLGGSAIASSAQTHAFGNVTSPPQDLAGLLSVRAADAPALHDLRGSWVAQVGAAQVGDDAAATAFAVRHHDWTTRFPTLLARGDDIGVPGLDDSWWLSLAAQQFGSKAEASAWCSTNSPTDCTPRLVSG